MVWYKQFQYVIVYYRIVHYQQVRWGGTNSSIMSLFITVLYIINRSDGVVPAVPVCRCLLPYCTLSPGPMVSYVPAVRVCHCFYRIVHYQQVRWCGTSSTSMSLFITVLYIITRSDGAVPAVRVCHCLLPYCTLSTGPMGRYQQFNYVIVYYRIVHYHQVRWCGTSSSSMPVYYRIVHYHQVRWCGTSSSSMSLCITVLYIITRSDGVVPAVRVCHWPLVPEGHRTRVGLCSLQSGLFLSVPWVGAARR